MIGKENLLRIGVLTKSHGIAGEVIIRLLPELFGYEPDPSWLFVDIMGGLVPFEVLSVRYIGQEALLLGLDTITDEEKAKRYQGAEVYIDPQELGEADETGDLNLNALVGCHVTDVQFGSVGDISAIHDIRQNPLAEIIYQGKSILIPLQEDFIRSYNRKTKELLVETPPGLISLYLE